MAKRRTRVAVAGTAAVGVLFGHWLTYLVEVPDARERAIDLAETGHAYLPAAGELAVLVMAVGVTCLLLGRLLRRTAGPSPLGALASRMALLQAGVFVVMEVAERIVAGSGLADLRHGPILLIGMAIQVVLAIAGAVTLRALIAVVDRIADSPSLARLASASPALLAVANAFARPRRAPSVPSICPRAPPSPACP